MNKRLVLALLLAGSFYKISSHRNIDKRWINSEGPRDGDVTLVTLNPLAMKNIDLSKGSWGAVYVDLDQYNKWEESLSKKNSEAFVVAVFDTKDKKIAPSGSVAAIYTKNSKVPEGLTELFSGDYKK